MSRRKLSPAMMMATILGGGDAVAPTVTITSSESSPSFINPIPVAFALSEVSTDFAIGDVTVGAGGTLGNFAGSGTAYTADLTITSAGATVTLDVAANAFHDAVGNGNTVATQFSVTLALSLYDEFTTDDAAPLSSPRTCEPGPGTITAVQTDGQFSISGGKLAWTAQASPAHGDERIDAPTVSKAAGVYAFYKKVVLSTGNTQTFGFDTNATLEPISFSARMDFLTFRITYSAGSAANVRTFATTTEYDLVLIMDGTLGYVFIRGGAFSRWTLLWVQTISETTLYPAISPYDTTGTLAGWVIGTTPESLFASAYAYATQRVASPANPQTLTALADALIEFTWTAATGETLTILFRRTDDDNTLKLVCSQTDSKAYMYKREAGVDTELGPAGGVATTFTNGSVYRILITIDGTTVTSHVSGTRKQNVTSTYNQTVAGAKVSGFATGSNFVSYPIDGTTALSTINSATLSFLVLGDSKSTSTGYPDDLVVLANATNGVFCTSAYPALDVGGYTLSNAKSVIDANLATRFDNPTWALLNYGANDVTALPTEAQWKSDLTYILDALHVKYPSMQVYIMRPWKRSEATDCNSLATWISDVVATRSSFAHLGPDERVFLENGDDGVTYTSDGIHPNAAGYALTAAEWKTVLGL